ncbi:hypothetical protein AALB16_15910 [Lachnospiraceae bacterium 62-35]
MKIQEVDPMGKYVDFYCKDNNRELKKIVNPIIAKKFGWIPQKDFDDFYSIAGQTVWRCENSFHEKDGISFKDYLIPCINRKIKMLVTYMNRDKRMIKERDEEGNIIYVQAVSIDMPIGDKDDCTLSEVIEDSFDMDKEIFGDQSECDTKIQMYLNHLSKRQRKIAELLIDAYEAGEIRRILHITEKEYFDAMKGIRAYENVSILL